MIIEATEKFQFTIIGMNRYKIVHCWTYDLLLLKYQIDHQMDRCKTDCIISKGESLEFNGRKILFETATRNTLDPSVAINLEPHKLTELRLASSTAVAYYHWFDVS